ncbi:MAG: hypothetical protein IKD92_10610 [Lachnospiraceae bacterium]|nr:hypothetical protein [Lachnospiraceae bacterium]
MKKTIATVAASVLLSGVLCMTAFGAEAGDHDDYGIPEYNPTLIHESQEDYENGRVAVEPTCTEDGIYRFDCTQPSESGVYFHEVVIPALGHDWDEGVVTKEPTCTEPGVMTYTCQRCGETRTEEIKAHGHVWSSDVDGDNWGRVTKEATCQETGEAEDFCTICGEVNTEVKPRVLEKKPHRFEYVQDSFEKATCISDGKETGHNECVDCGETEPDSQMTDTWVWTDPGEEADEYDEPHDWDGLVTEKAATCAEPGIAVQWCKKCGVKREQEIPALEENYVVVSTRLIDCYTEEYTWRCSNCDGEFHEDYTTEGPTKAHTFRLEAKYQDEEKSADPDCTHYGYNVYKCVHYDDLGNDQEKHDELVEEVDFHFNDRGTDVVTTVPYYEGYKTVVIDPVNHKWGNWIKRHGAGEGDNEYSYWIRECKECHTTDELVAATDVSEVINPTCTEAGKYIYLDGHEEEIPALGHEIVEDAAIDATCTETGLTAGSHCAVCGEVIVAQEEVPALGHDYEVETLIDVTCTKDGLTRSTCKNCGDVKYETIEATGHKEVEIPAVAPTADSVGYTAGTKCEICGEILVAPEEIAKVKNGLVHDEDGKWRLYDMGEVDSDFTGIYEYDGGEFYLQNGILQDDANGLNLIGKTWYFLSQGQIQREDGFAEYDDNWFMIDNGELDKNANGLYTYKTDEGEGVFLFAAGRLRRDVNGLWQDHYGTYGPADTWYYLADGQVVNYTGVAEYNGSFFVVENGVFNNNYNGTIEYDGATFNVVAGQLYDQVKAAEAA